VGPAPTPFTSSLLRIYGNGSICKRTHYPNFAVSPDGRRVVFGHVEYQNSEIALLRNFR